MLLLCCDSIASYSNCHLHRWRGLLLSAKLGRCDHRSVLTCSSRLFDTPPLFKNHIGLPADKCSSAAGIFIDFGRHYSAQPVRDNCLTEARLKQEPDVISHEQFRSNVSKDSEAAIRSAYWHSSDSVAIASTSNTKHSADTVEKTVANKNGRSPKFGLVQRFRKMYKQYGAVLACVHVVTSSVWFSLFYCVTVRYAFKLSFFCIRVSR